jgi:hypothetical protein
MMRTSEGPEASAGATGLGNCALPFRAPWSGEHPACETQCNPRSIPNG